MVLEDGKFNVERARLLDKSRRQLSIDAQGRTSKFNEYTDTDVTLSSTDCLWIIAFRLPVRSTVSGGGGRRSYKFSWHAGNATNTSSRHAGYVVERLRYLRQTLQIWYIGWLGIEIPEEDQEAVKETLAKQFQCVPVFLSAEQGEDLESFCGQILRPMFHFVVPSTPHMCHAFNQHDDDDPTPSSLPGGAHETLSQWQQYNQVNNDLASALVERYNEGDFVWVVDIELLMVPAAVAARCPGANIGFVFNTPFPSSDIYRMLPARKEVLRSLLCADLIVFHCFTYARHLLTSCSRLLGIEYHSMRAGLAQLTFRGHAVHIRPSHVGMDSEAFLAKLAADNEHQRFALEWKTLFKDRHVVLGYDDLEPMSGIVLLLEAVKSLVRLFPSILGRLVVVVVAVPLVDAHGRHLHTAYQEQVEGEVSKLNAQHPGLVLFYQRRMAFSERTALFRSADMLVNSAVRHGLNLVPLEFVLCAAEKKGGVVVSEFLGCSRVLPGAIRSNPWRDEDLGRAIYKLLVQEEREKGFWHRLQEEFCRNNTVFKWALDSLLDMKKLRETALRETPDRRLEDRRSSCRVGIAKVPHSELSEKTLRLPAVYAAYNAAETRLIIVDIDLLLRPILHPDKTLEGAPMSKQEILKCLANIASYTGNFLFLLSSNSADEIRNWFPNMADLDKLGLAAEDGFCYKWPGSPFGRWDTRMPVSTAWKDVAVGLMQQYTQRTNGSWIEDDKVSSVTWHFERANADFGALQGKELQSHLSELLSHFPVRISLSKNLVRVRHLGVTKGALVQHIINHYNSRGGVDFVLALGDDVADEDMFKVIASYHKDVQYRVTSGSNELQEVKVFGCTVGKQPSSAAYCLYKAEEVLELMAGLYLQNKHRSFSMMELSGSRSPRAPPPSAPAPPYRPPPSSLVARPKDRTTWALATGGAPRNSF